ncbi:MAG: TlpA disulfide reductase family protein [Planctomycetota bacterium]|nr:TlpA disulfide reductase family protein [Planctomycetota bacterium]
MKRAAIAIAIFALLGLRAAAVEPPDGRAELYRAVLASPGGELPFLLELESRDQTHRAWIINGRERIEVPRVSVDSRQITLDIEHFASTITAVPANRTRVLRGEWKKRVGRNKWSTLPFSAEPARGYRFTPLTRKENGPEAFSPISGRWRVRFSKSSEPAVGIFECLANGVVEGTFLTTTGDYRFLAGSYEMGRLRLSCFDGAHAFLFDARIKSDGTLEGDFWSRDTWHETWTAARDDSAELPDGFTLTKYSDRVRLDELEFPDLEGRPRSLNDPEFRGKVRILELFGSWCPNCHDAARFLVDLDRRYRDRGLRILGLAFETTGDRKRDAAQVRRFIKRHDLGYPILIAGIADKKAASKVLPFLDRLRAYPTTVLLRADGSVRAVHTGFTGPASDREHQEHRRRFESMIESALEEAGAGP